MSTQSRKALFEAGMSISQIADLEGVTRQSVVRTLRKQGLRSPGRKIDSTIADSRKKRYLAGQSIAKIAAQDGISKEGVRISLGRSGVTIRNPQKEPKFYDPQTDQEIENLYLEGLSINKVAEFEGISRHEVVHTLKRLGVQLRKPLWVKRDTNKKIVNRKKKYLSGMTVQEISEDESVSARSVRRSLKKLDLKVEPEVKDRPNVHESRKSRYLAGVSINEISRQDKIKVGAVRKSLTREGIDLPKHAWFPDHEARKQKFLSGMTPAEIAASENSSSAAIRRSLNKLGIEVAQKDPALATREARYNSGMTVPEIAAQDGISPIGLYKFMRRKGIVLRQQKREVPIEIDGRRILVTPRGKARIERYLAGDSVQQIGQAEGVSHQAVYSYLQSQGIPIRVKRGSSPNQAKIRNSRVERYQAGSSISEIAASDQVTEGSVRRSLIQTGIQLPKILAPSQSPCPKIDSGSGTNARIRGFQLHASLCQSCQGQRLGTEKIQRSPISCRPDDRADCRRRWSHAQTSADFPAQARHQDPVPEKPRGSHDCRIQNGPVSGRLEHLRDRQRR